FGLAAFAALIVTVLGNLGEIRVLRLAAQGSIPNDWWFWYATRVIHPGPGEPGPITEFPAFTFIYGDLHAHAMALPLAALTLALVVAVVRDARSLMSTWVRLGLLGLVLGALSATNTWDLPTYALVVVCALVIAALAQERSRRTLVGLIVALVGVGLVAYLSFLPFHLHNASVYQGFTRWHGRQSRFFDYLTVHGLFLFAVVSGLAVQLAYGRDLGSVARACRLGLRSWDRLARLPAPRRAPVRGTPLHRAGIWAVAATLLLAAVLAGFRAGP